MKKVVLAAVVAGGFLTMAFREVNTVAADNVTVAEVVTPAKGKAYKVATTQSTLTWTGKKVTGEHTGTIKVSQGEVFVEKNAITGGTFIIDMNSITCTDLTDAEYNKKLVGHLRSDDFFSVEKNPTATFVITGVQPIKGAKAGANNYNVKGNLTIKGITKPIEFPAKVTAANGTVTTVADIAVNRTLYDIRYGSGSFFDDLGDKAIDDNFNINLKVVAKQ